MKAKYFLNGLYVMLAIVSFFSCDPPNKNVTGVPPSFCNITAEAESYFKYEAAQLAINQLQTENSGDTALVIIPHAYYNAYLKALGLIYDATTLWQRDSVISKHLFCKLNNTHSVLISTGSVWSENWMNHVIPTGNAAVDGAIINYHLTIAADPFASPLPMYIIESNQPINGQALAHFFASQPDVNFAEPNTYYSFQSKLTGSFTGDIAHIVFYEGWGDCPAGCFGYHRWEFDVNINTCSVNFSGYYP